MCRQLMTLTAHCVVSQHCSCQLCLLSLWPSTTDWDSITGRQCHYVYPPLSDCYYLMLLLVNVVYLLTQIWHYLLTYLLT